MNEHKVFKTPVIPLILMITGLNRLFGNIILSVFVGGCIYVTAMLTGQV